MLVLTRKPDEQVSIGGNLMTITVVEIRENKVRLGFRGPRWVQIDREEVRGTPEYEI